MFNTIFIIIGIVTFITDLVNSTKFERYELVPDLIPVAPIDLIDVSFGKAIPFLREGSNLDSTDIQSLPVIYWQANNTTLYTMMLLDADVPNREMPILRATNHWLVVNIPGCEVSSGDTLASYLLPSPPSGLGPHRYAFLAYQQLGEINVTGIKEYYSCHYKTFTDDLTYCLDTSTVQHDVIVIKTVSIWNCPGQVDLSNFVPTEMRKSSSSQNRVRFSAVEFADTFNLLDPVAGNFFIGVPNKSYIVPKNTSFVAIRNTFSNNTFPTGIGDTDKLYMEYLVEKLNGEIKSKS